MNSSSSVFPAGPIEPGCIAVVGLAGHFPAARTAGELWALLKGDKPATEWLSDEQLRAAGVCEADLADPHYVRAGMVLPDMEMFDADFFGFSQRDASVMDPQHRHFLECAWEALEDAGHMPENLPAPSRMALRFASTRSFTSASIDVWASAIKRRKSSARFFLASGHIRAAASIA